MLRLQGDKGDPDELLGVLFACFWDAKERSGAGNKASQQGGARGSKDSEVHRGGTDLPSG